MRTTTLSIFLFLLSLNIKAQTIETLTLPGCDTISWGAYGGPKISLITPMNKSAIMLGGQGAVVLNNQFALGGFGQGMTGSTSFDGTPYGHDESLELSMGYGGIYLEYMPFRNKLFHPSISLPVGLGGASVSTKDSETKISKSSILTFTPRIGLDFNVGENAVISLFAGYQLISAKDDFLVENHKLSGWELGLCVKLGKF